MQQDCWDEIGPAPAPICNLTFTINSGYRNPAHNAAIAGSAANSRHQFGDAADINTATLTRWNVLHDIAKARGACVEPLAASTRSHVHVEWPDMKFITDPFTCKTGW